MSWAMLDRGRVPRVVGVSLAIVFEKGTKTAARLFLRVAAEIAKVAGIAVAERSRVDIFLGDGPQAGQMKIVAGPKGAFTCNPSKKKGTALNIACRAPPGFPRQLKTQVCTVLDAGADGIVFVLPFGKATETNDVLPLDEDAFAVADGEAGPGVERELITAKPGVGRLNLRPADDEASGEERQESRSPAVSAVDAWCEGKGAEQSKPPPAAAEAKAPPAAPAVAAAPIQRKRTFRHGSETVALPIRHYAVATRLYTAMSKGLGFIPYADLMAAIHVKAVDDLAIEMDALGMEVAPLKLDVKEVRKMGYYMRPLAGNGARP